MSTLAQLPSGVKGIRATQRGKEIADMENNALSLIAAFSRP